MAIRRYIGAFHWAELAVNYEYGEVRSRGLLSVITIMAPESRPLTREGAESMVTRYFPQRYYSARQPWTAFFSQLAPEGLMMFAVIDFRARVRRGPEH